MRRSWAALTVGALSLLVLTLSFVLFKYTSERSGIGKGYKVVARFRDAWGLGEKSGVRIAGLDVGRLDKKELDDNAQAKVTIMVNPGIKLYKNALIQKKSGSLLGEFYLELDPGAPFEQIDGQKVAVPLLRDGDEIVHVREPLGMNAIMDEVATTVPILRDILKDVRSMTSGSVKEIADTVNDMVAKNSVVLERLLLRVDDIASDVQGITRAEADNIKTSIQNVREITEGLKGLVGTTQGNVNTAGQDLKTTLQKIQSSVDHLDKSLNNVEKITETVANGEGTVGHLIKDDTVARNVEAITEDVGNLTRGVSRLQTIVGLRTEYNFLAHTYKNYFSITLMPRPDKFYLFEIVDDPRGFREASTTFIDASDTGPRSETKVTTTEKLRFTFMFGKRVGPVTGRFGIKESTGGVGVDVHLLDDRLTLSADVFDTRSNQYPRLQGRATLEVYKRTLFLVAGVDDVFNYTRASGGGGAFFDGFFGAQLQFNDDDLKSLLLMGGSGAAGAAGK